MENIKKKHEVIIFDDQEKAKVRGIGISWLLSAEYQKEIKLKRTKCESFPKGVKICYTSNYPLKR